MAAARLHSLWVVMQPDFNMLDTGTSAGKAVQVVNIIRLSHSTY